MKLQISEISLLDIEKYTQDMLQNARKGLWEEVMETQTLRNQLIHDYFEQTNSLPRKLLTEKICMILEVDKKIMTLGEKNRAGILAELTKINQGKKAVNAYAQGY